jgi:predicted ester cyclase
MKLAEIYEAYIACLNARDLTRLDGKYSVNASEEKSG